MKIKIFCMGPYAFLRLLFYLQAFKSPAKGKEVIIKNVYNLYIELNVVMHDCLSRWLNRLNLFVGFFTDSSWEYSITSNCHLCSSHFWCPSLNCVTESDSFDISFGCVFPRNCINVVKNESFLWWALLLWLWSPPYYSCVSGPLQCLFLNVSCI